MNSVIVKEKLINLLRLIEKTYNIPVSNNNLETISDIIIDIRTALYQCPESVQEKSTEEIENILLELSIYFSQNIAKSEIFVTRVKKIKNYIYFKIKYII